MWGSAGRREVCFPWECSASRCSTQVWGEDEGELAQWEVGKGGKWPRREGDAEALPGKGTSQSDSRPRPPIREGGTPRDLACGEVRKSQGEPRHRGWDKEREMEREREVGTHHLVPPQVPTLLDPLRNPLDKGLVLVGGVDKLDVDAECVGEAAHVAAAVLARGERQDVDVVEPGLVVGAAVVRGGGALDGAAVREVRVVTEGGREGGREGGEGRGREEGGEALCRGGRGGVSRCGQGEGQEAQEDDGAGEGDHMATRRGGGRRCTVTRRVQCHGPAGAPLGWLIRGCVWAGTATLTTWGHCRRRAVAVRTRRRERLETRRRGARPRLTVPCYQRLPGAASTREAT